MRAVGTIILCGMLASPAYASISALSRAKIFSFERIQMMIRAIGDDLSKARIAASKLTEDELVAAAELQGRKLDDVAIKFSGDDLLMFRRVLTGEFPVSANELTTAASALKLTDEQSSIIKQLTAGQLNAIRQLTPDEIFLIRILSDEIYVLRELTVD